MKFLDTDAMQSGAGAPTNRASANRSAAGRSLRLVTTSAGPADVPPSKRPTGASSNDDLTVPSGLEYVSGREQSDLPTASPRPAPLPGMRGQRRREIALASEGGGRTPEPIKGTSNTEPAQDVTPKTLVTFAFRHDPPRHRAFLDAIAELLAASLLDEHRAVAA